MCAGNLVFEQVLSLGVFGDQKKQKNENIFQVLVPKYSKKPRNLVVWQFWGFSGSQKTKN